MKNILSLLLFLPLAAAFGKSPELPEPAYDNLPRWRGFNLLEKFQHEPDDFSKIAPSFSFRNGPFLEKDFQIISEWGFNFVRLPMSYRCWINGENLLDFNEKALRDIDQAVKWGRKYNIHVCICMHRAPGYCVSGIPAEKYDLWTDEYIQDIFAAHWAMFAKRYKGIPNKYLSFDLVNEPITTDEQYEKVLRKAVKAIRDIDPERLIIVDGIDCGSRPMTTIDDMKVAQSGRGYSPLYVTHWRAPFTQWWNTTREEDSKKPPTWPYVEPSNGFVWDKHAFSLFFEKWITYRADSNRGVHIGEFGCSMYAPHDVVLGFFSDMLSTLKENNIGWAMWELRGVNSVLDSQRDDVTYESYRGHRLDRKMLEILQAN